MDSNGRPSRHVHRPARSIFFQAAAILLAAAVAFAPAPLVAIEPAQEFLDGLHGRGLNELALDYLDRMQSSTLVNDEFRSQIPYHRGVTLIEQSRQTADAESRNRLLEQARAELEKYAAANPQNVSGADAQMQLATVLMERGQQQAIQAAALPSDSAYDAERRKQQLEAQRLLAEARAVFQSAEGLYSAELEKLPPPAGDTDGAEPDNRRQKYREKVAQLLFYSARALFEAAQTFDPASDEFKNHHETAARELSAVYEEFSRAVPLPGFYARLYEGRCYQALGSYQLALGSFEDVRSLPNVLPPLRKLIAAAHRFRGETLVLQDKVDAAIENYRACLSNAKPEEEKQPEWLAVRFRLAEALRQKGEKLPTDSLDRRKLEAEARDAYRTVANSPGEFQLAARTQIASLGRNANAADQNPPRTFQEAYDRGKDALASFNAAKLAFPTAQRLNPTAVPELEEQMEQGKDDARRNFRAAATLIDDDTDPKLVNEVRYFLCWLHWESGDYFQAAVLGEFLARRYPDHPAASAAAKLAMASFERLYFQAAAAGGDKDATEFEARRMAQIAEFITRRWPDSPDADAAFSVLVNYAIRGGRIDDAQKMLDQASESSRPRLELQLGNAMWARYLELAQQNGENSSDETKLSELKAAASKFLRSGIDAARRDRNINESTAVAGLYLVQSLLGDGQYEDAIKLLTDERIGPLTLVSSGHESASRPQYAIEVYKAALRAYVSVTPPRNEDAVEIMTALEKMAAAADGDGVEQVTRIYIGLGGTLQRQINDLRTAGRNEEADRLSNAFAELLTRISDRQHGSDWGTRLWIAQSHYAMADTATARRTGPSPAPTQAGPARGPARTTLEKARDGFAKLLAAAAADPKLPPNEAAVLTVKMQLGECYRQLGQYQQALDMFSDVLKDKESSLTVQRAAAYTYQQRGQFGDAKWLERAVQGGYQLKSTGKNRIWGWLRIAQVAQRAAAADKKYWDNFFEARLNVARCRYFTAMKTKGAARQQNLARARQNIQSMLQLYPSLGGERWHAEFDALMKDIQKAGNQSPIGLREFAARKSTANKGES